MTERSPNLEVQLGFAATAAASLTGLVWFVLDGVRSTGVDDGTIYFIGSLACGALLALVVDLVLFLGLRSVWMAWAMARDEDPAQVDDARFGALYRMGSGWFADGVGRFLRWAVGLSLLSSVRLSARLELGPIWVGALVVLGLLIALGPRVSWLAPLASRLRAWLWQSWRLPGAPKGWRKGVDLAWSFGSVCVFALAVFSYTLPPVVVFDDVLAPDELHWLRVELTALRGPETSVQAVIDGPEREAEDDGTGVALDFERLGDVFVAKLPTASLAAGRHRLTVEVQASFDSGERFSSTERTEFLLTQGRQ